MFCGTLRRQRDVHALDLTYVTVHVVNVTNLLGKITKIKAARRINRKQHGDLLRSCKVLFLSSLSLTS